MRSMLIALIRGYQVILSPLLGDCCRFQPSCSAYAVDAIRVHGAWQGVVLAFRRVLRCHPFHPGGCDPVPERDAAVPPQIRRGDIVES